MSAKGLSEDAISAIQRRFNPRTDATTSAEFFVDIDRDFPGVRGQSWSEHLTRKVRRAADDSPARLLFSGLPGTGKSTELRRVAELLGGDSDRPLLPILVDMADFTDPNAPLDVADVLLACVFRTFEQLFIEQGKSPKDARAQTLDPGILKRVSEFFTSNDVGNNGVEVGVSSVGPGVNVASKITISLRQHHAVRARLRDAVLRNFDSFVERVREEFVSAVSTVKHGKGLKKRYGGIVLVIDSIEKLKGTDDNWRAVLDSAQSLVDRYVTNLDLGPCVHAILTVPPALLFRSKAASIEFLPMIKSSDAGKRAIRAIVSRRVSPEDIAAIIPPSAMPTYESLIDLCGGFPRDVIEVLYKILAECEGPPLTTEALLKVTRQLRDQYESLVDTNSQLAPILAQIHHSKRVSVDSSQHQELDRLLALNLVLRYQNDATWMDVHPAALEHPLIVAELAKLRAAPETKG